MTQYQVFFTPRSNLLSYGDEIDVTDYIFQDGIESIKSSIDSTNYAIGVFTYGDIRIRGSLKDGFFGEPFDYRSIFRFSRDQCKVRVVFTNEDGSNSTYHGLITEKATVVDGIMDTITFRVLSLDSVFSTVKISSGAIADNANTTAAFKTILNVPEVTAVLNYSDANIDPAYEFEIDVGAAFDNKTIREMVDQLLVVTNSILVIDDDLNIIIKSREVDFDADVTMFYGPFDIHGRENIISIRNYNNGQHRQFNSVVVNEQVADNDALIETFGVSKIEFTFDFVTDTDKAFAIAQTLVDEFSAPKIELEMLVSTKVGRDLRLSDVVAINWPLRLVPRGDFFPIIGITEIGSDTEPLPDNFGSFQIPPNVGFKVIEITENPKDFTTLFKLRQMGTTMSDGIFNPLAFPIIGIAVIGISRIAEGDTDTWNPSVVGAAKIGFTELVA